jgi:MraZ protein
MFLGRFYHNLDDKGRLTIPAGFRNLLVAEAGAYITLGFDQNLMVLPSSTFNSLSRRVNQMSVTNPTTRLLRRLVYSTADRVEVDKAGRILIPQFLRQAAGLVNSAVIVGSGEYFEIWSPELWNAQDEQLQDVESNTLRFSALDLTSE